ncbi:unnamed protein product [Paramecium octaurelia]|uniref:Uncharacterized protein n=1 Tax=Paramecium octaurelia TaxID=43137 RepID=A0A8S1RY17_PAROT|nr:unnamed protein product [Paramecium octaurelia]
MKYELEESFLVVNFTYLVKKWRNLLKFIKNIIKFWKHPNFLVFLLLIFP